MSILLLNNVCVFSKSFQHIFCLLVAHIVLSVLVFAVVIATGINKIGFCGCVVREVLPLLVNLLGTTLLMVVNSQTFV